MTGSPHRRRLDGNLGEVLRDGDHVTRPAGPWTPAVHRLLGELASAGVPEVPRPVRERLLELADVTDGLAESVGRPELHDHAALYRRDAVSLPGR